MFTCKAISSPGYYLSGAEIERLSYYFGGTAAASWWVPPSSNERARTRFGVEDGEPVGADAFQDLCAGILPDGTAIARKEGIRRPAYDLQFAAPKSVSVLALLGGDEVLAKIVAAHDCAVRRALTSIGENGWLQARRGKGGQLREGDATYCAAIFRHLTSRENDPQLHSHCVVPNLAIRSDGTIGGLDNRTLLKFQRLAGALYRAELASQLRKAGIAVRPDDKAFDLPCVPEAVTSLFSKRRNQIEKLAATRGFDPSVDRKAAQIAALDTRRAKPEEAPFHVLRGDWNRQLNDAGLSGMVPTSLAEASVHESPGPSRALDGAIGTAFANDAVLSWPRLLAAVAEDLQCEKDADEIEALFRNDLPGQICNTGDEKAPVEDRLVSTPAMLDMERELIRAALQGRNVRPYVSKGIVEFAIAANPLLSDEQQAAARHALNTDRISIFEGAAGSGKSFALGVVASICRDSGLRVIASAPSWSATNVLAADTGASEQDKRALAALLADTDAGRLTLNRNTVVLLDEAGMVPTPDMARLVELVARSDAKLICSGDTQQLPPVGAGAPLRLLARVLGTSRMDQIRRQKVAWCRAASMQFASGRTAQALDAYDFHKNIDWCNSSGDAIVALADRYIADALWDREANPERPSSVLAIASYNEDVLELNSQIRERLQAAGFISQAELELPVSTRNRRGKSGRSSLRLAKGDRIAFGETISLAERTIRNADVAMIAGFDAGYLVLKFDRDGQTIRAKPEDLVGFRRKDDPPLPMLRHAYAVTVHFSQGMTVDRTYIAAIRPMHREALYVAMTRHRESAHIYVDTSRFNATSRISGWPKALPKEGALAGAQKKMFYEECEKPGEKRNACDFVSDLEEWAIEVDPVRAPVTQYQSMAGRTRDRMQRRTLQQLQFAGPTAKAPLSGMPNALYRGVKYDLDTWRLNDTSKREQLWLAWLRKRISQLVQRLKQVTRTAGLFSSVAAKYRVRSKEPAHTKIPTKIVGTKERDDATSAPVAPFSNFSLSEPSDTLQPEPAIPVELDHPTF